MDGSFTNFDQTDKRHFYHSNHLEKDEKPSQDDLFDAFFSTNFSLIFLIGLIFLFLKLLIYVFHYLKSKNQQPVNAVLHSQTSPPSYHDCITITKDEQDNQKLPSYAEACKIQIQDPVKETSNANGNHNSTNVAMNNSSEITKSTNNTLV